MLILCFVSGGEDILITALNEKNDDGSSGKVYLFSGRSISSVYTYSVYKNDYPTILQASNQLNKFFFKVNEKLT